MQERFEVIYSEVVYTEILYQTRDMIHRGYKLLTHPLAGSMKPNQTPYKSIMLEKNIKADDESVVMIENAILSAEKFLKQKAIPPWNDKIRDDFKTVDLSLIENVAKRCI